MFDLQCFNVFKQINLHKQYKKISNNFKLLNISFVQIMLRKNFAWFSTSFETRQKYFPALAFVAFLFREAIHKKFFNFVEFFLINKFVELFCICRNKNSISVDEFALR